MMKRIIACLVAVVCLLTSLAFAEGITMKVVNVNTAVNLRKGPSTDTESLAQVPVGTVVTDCVKTKNGKWYSVNYEGITGYIRADKLQEVKVEATKKPKSTKKPKATKAPETNAPETNAVAEGQPLVAEGQPLVAEGEPLTPADSTAKEQKTESVIQENVENAPVSSINDQTEYDDDYVILEATLGDIRVLGRQIYQANNEYLMAVGLDKYGQEIWKKETTTDGITELSQTDVFIGGTADAPLVLMYNACRGLTAIQPADGEVAWEILKQNLDLGGSISHVVDDGGVTFIGGYYGPDPVAIDATGKVLWQASSGAEQATWLYRMELRDNGIACAYGSMAGENTGTIVYGFDGSVVDVIYD